MIGIYLITNKINNKKYVGQALDIEGRWKRHISDSKKSECHIHRALRKYGVENFSFEVLEECNTNKLDEREIYWINELDTYKNGYNMTLGGGGSNKGKNSYSDEYYKQYNQDHKEEIKQYYQDRKEEYKQYHKQYYQDRKEELREQHKQYNQDHKEELKRYREDHKEEQKQYNKQYYQDHKEEIKQYRLRKKSKKG